MLEMVDVHKYYKGPGGTSVKAVDGAMLSVGAGEVVAIFGPSGSGKTTFLLLAAGLLAPDQGMVEFDGKELASLSQEKILCYRREQLGFIFQTFNLVPGLSALDNIVVPRLLTGIGYRQAEAHARELLDTVGLGDRALHRPDQLSGGEQQRVAIARALAGEPSLILADEPTGNLDTARGDEVLKLLTELAREHAATVLLVTHDLRAAQYADRIEEMHDGRLYPYDELATEKLIARSNSEKVHEHHLGCRESVIEQ